jgi:hypothetical protein
MLFIPPIGDLDAQSGLWSREQLLEMDSRFVAALEAAFAKGLESRAAAAATVRIGRNGNAAAIESAIGAAWNSLRDRKGEMSASEVLAFVRELVPGVPPERVRAEFKRRLFSWVGEAR